MKKLVCLAAIAMMFSFNVDAEEEIERVDPCWAFATQAATYEWDNGIIDTDAEWYHSWNYWYDQCEIGF